MIPASILLNGRKDFQYSEYLFHALLFLVGGGGGGGKRLFEENGGKKRVTYCMSKKSYPFSHSDYN